MPLVRGYSRESVAQNIRRELRAGRSLQQSIRIAHETARRAWRSSHPTGPYPERLRRRR